LEALSFGLPVIASDIPANLELGLPAEHYFALGNVDQLARRLDMFTSRKMDLAERDERIEWVLERYNWRSIAKATLGVYQNIGK
jgi:glycosyltransferase involved in cell wall biosynthesis